MAVDSGRCEMAKKPSHMEIMPATLRHRCSFQLVGIRLRCVRRVQMNSSTTDGMPRKSTTWASEAPRSEATFTQAPMPANMILASSIHRDCMRLNQITQDYEMY
jgi:hypothetical protein